MPIALKSEQLFYAAFVKTSEATAKRKLKAARRADCKAAFDPIDAIELKDAYAAAMRDGDLRRDAERAVVAKAFMAAGMTAAEAKKAAQAEGQELTKAFLAVGMTKAEAKAAKKAAREAGQAAMKITSRQKELINRVEFIEYTKRINRDEPTRQSAKDRLNIGYVWKGGWVSGKSYQSAFVEKGKRSDRHWLLMRHAASTPKVRSGLFAGMGNGDARKAWNKKLPALDCTHATMNTEVRDCFRVELDKSFKSIAELMFELEEADYPMPNIITWIPCETLPEGTVNKPHLWHYLPDKKGVYGHGNVSDRMLQGVAAALFAKLEHLGADPGGLANIHDGKNPLSPHASYYISNDTHLPTLSELAEKLDVTLDCATMARLMSIRKIERTHIGTRSNEVYDWCYSTSSLLARELHKKGIIDANALDFDCTRFAEIIETEMHARAKVEFPEFKGAELEALLECCSARATWAAEKFEVITLSGGVNRGAARDKIKPTDALATKQGAGGTYARQSVMEKNIKAMAKAMLPALRADKVPNEDHVTVVTGLHIKTVRNRWDAALKMAQGFLFQHIVTKVAIALTPVCKGKKLPWVGDTLQQANLNPAIHGAAPGQHATAQPSTADPASGDPGQPPTCIFEAFAEAHRQSRRAEASGSYAA
ncbi:hypothetical protein FIU28_17055 [Tardiphaga sp. vice154]|uniref:hypothetical protein n=1 Tax=Tardiphaga sp. vice154 TaxID=2592814 RepID=UPI0011622C80|nr:hypothetical protein [Tardiphaga sp. vice154]QDM22669.1 hypothetical protein FIU28_17055 [Tardiphaga sp. vice154]